MNLSSPTRATVWYNYWFQCVETTLWCPDWSTIGQTNWSKWVTNKVILKFQYCYFLTLFVQPLLSQSGHNQVTTTTHCTKKMVQVFVTIYYQRNIWDGFQEIIQSVWAWSAASWYANRAVCYMQQNYGNWPKTVPWGRPITTETTLLHPLQTLTNWLRSWRKL